MGGGLLEGGRSLLGGGWQVTAPGSTADQLAREDARPQGSLSTEALSHCLLLPGTGTPESRVTATQTSIGGGRGPPGSVLRPVLDIPTGGSAQGQDTGGVPGSRGPGPSTEHPRAS